jgi:hypothetical protein
MAAVAPEVAPAAADGDCIGPKEPFPSPGVNGDIPVLLLLFLLAVVVVISTEVSPPDFSPSPLRSSRDSVRFSRAAELRVAVAASRRHFIGSCVAAQRRKALHVRGTTDGDVSRR